MTGPFPATRVELQRWRAEGLVLPVWWRDDDATEPTQALERLLETSGRFDAPLHLAVIPGQASPELAARVAAAGRVCVLTHGWRHVNHAPPDQKKAEFGPHRPLHAMTGDISSGRRRLENLFGSLALPIFTPPWNRIAPEVTQRLRTAGFKALSTYLPRTSKFAANGVLQVNTHLDPVAWKSGGGLLDPALLDAQLARGLEARRSGEADNGEPYGLLTHHLVQDEATWTFTERLLDLFAASGVARWRPPLPASRRSG